MRLINWIKSFVTEEKKNGLTIFQQQTLLSVAFLKEKGKPVYSVPVAEMLEVARQKRVGVLRAREVLAGLEREGYLDSLVVPGGAIRDFKPMTCYRLLAKGEQTVAELKMDGA